MKALEKYLPKKPQDVTRVQALIDGGLHNKIKTYLDENDLGWNDLITALLTRLIDEIETKPERKQSGKV